MNPKPKNKRKPYQQLMQGIQQTAPNLVLMLAGQTYSGPQLLSILRSLVAAESTVAAQKEAWLRAVRAKDGLEAQYASTITALRQTLQVMYGPTAPDLVAFGVTPRAPRQRLSKEAIANRSAKAAVTRRARRAAAAQASAVPATRLTPGVSPGEPRTQPERKDDLTIATRSSDHVPSHLEPKGRS